MNRKEILERERNLAPYAGIASILVPVLFIASTAIATSISVSDGVATDEIRTFSDDRRPSSPPRSFAPSPSASSRCLCTCCSAPRRRAASG